MSLKVKKLLIFSHGQCVCGNAKQVMLQITSAKEGIELPESCHILKRILVKLALAGMVRLFRHHPVYQRVVGSISKSGCVL